MVETTIQEKADAMYRDVIHQFIEARRTTIDRVEAKLASSLDYTAKEVGVATVCTCGTISTRTLQVETTISQAWAVAGYTVEEIAARAHAADVAMTVRHRLVEMEVALRSAMKDAERDIPTCYPPVTVES